MRIYFARHGESEANLLHIISNRDLPHGLTTVGRQQSARLADQLQDRPIIHIYTSPQKRAVETSDILAKRLKVEYEKSDGLREYDCGIAEGRSDEAAWGLWQEEYDAWVLNRDFDYHLEGGETFQEVRQRFSTFIDQLINTHADTHAEVVCVSHGGIYSVMFPLIMQNVTPAMVLRYGFDYTGCIVAEHRAKGLECIEWNGVHIKAD